ncbi:MAG: nucleotide pyrophosphohydrolase [Alphaproteobacteria bacterium]
MNIQTYQTTVDAWIKTMGGYFSPLSQLAQLTEEVGELARLINRVHGDQSFKKGEKDEASIPDEMADILFTLTCMANTLKIDLTNAVARNMEKKTARDATRHTKNGKLPLNI